jgi:hypothetical protein
MNLPKLQIDDILRHLIGDDNQESAPSFPHLYQLPHLSHRLHRPVLLQSTRGWQPPLTDSLDLLKAILQPSHLHEEGYSGQPSHLESSYVHWRRTSDDVQPQHCRGGKTTFLHCTLVKVSTELLTLKRCRHVSLLSVEHRLLARTTDRWRGFTGGWTFQNTIHDVKRNKRLARWQ